MTTMLDEERLKDFEPLEVPTNANRTSEYKIPDEAWEAYIAALDEIDDMSIALQIGARPTLVGDVVELDDFIRQQGHDPADFAE
jgi:hypothetical protein